MLPVSLASRYTPPYHPICRSSKASITTRVPDLRYLLVSRDLDRLVDIAPDHLLFLSPSTFLARVLSPYSPIRVNIC